MHKTILCYSNKDCVYDRIGGIEMVDYKRVVREPLKEDWKALASNIDDKIF